MYSYDHDLEEFVAIGLGTVSEDGSVVASNTGVGVIKAGWHCGSQPSNSGCVSGKSCSFCKKSRTGDCSNNDCIEDLAKSGVPLPADQQTAGDCQTKTCSGSVNNNSDVPDNDVQGDCKKPGCVNGVAKDVADDDKPEGEVCKKCDNKSLVVDSDKEGTACSSEEGQECYTCKDGKCGNNCKASSITSSETLSLGGNIAGYIENFKSKVKRLSMNKIGVIVEPKLSYTAKTGEECCNDCSIGNGIPVNYTEHSGDTSFKLSIEAYPITIPDLEFTLVGLTLRANATLSPGVDKNLAINGTVSGKETECEDIGCIEANVGGTANGSMVVKVDAGVEITLCDAGSNHTAEDCPSLLSLGAGGNAKISASLSLYAKSRALCDTACGEVSGNVGQLSASGSVGYEIKLISVLKYKKQAEFNEVIEQGFNVKPLGNCN
jgi:hypothetical protein